VSDTLGETGAAARIGGGKPWLALMPNGGQTYDMDTRKCGWYGGETPSQGDEWAGQLGDIVRAATNKGVWGRILVGGCCKLAATSYVCWLKCHGWIQMAQIAKEWNA